jgi:hypothetical protein
MVRVDGKLGFHLAGSLEQTGLTTRTGHACPVEKPRTFVVDGGGWSRTEVIEACHRILRALEVDSRQFETDIPADAGDWPPEVATAARLLRGVADGGNRSDRDYAQTGVVEVKLDEVWSAFVTFVPWAFDASVWDAQYRDIVSFADEGQSIVVRLRSEQLEAISVIVGPDRLVPARQWSRRRKNLSDQLMDRRSVGQTGMS